MLKSELLSKVKSSKYVSNKNFTQKKFTHKYLTYKYFLSLFVILGLSLTMTSCYVDGGVGPQGPPGEGLNRFVTYNYNIRAVDWVQQVGDINTYLYQKSNTDITSGVINNGMVLVYARFDGKPWVQLPMTNHYTDNGIPYTLEYLPYHTVGAFEIQYVDSHPQPVAPGMFTELRVVIVEGTDYLSSIKNTDLNNYNEVIANLTRVQNIQSEAK